MKADVETEKAVLEALLGSWDAYAVQDLDKVLSYYAPDPDLVAIGTSVGEKYIGRQAIGEGLTKDFAQSQGSLLRITWSSISSSGNVAWVAADCEAEVMSRCGVLLVPGRLTAVLEKRGEKWLIMQTHFSVGVGGQPRGDSFPFPMTG